ncbi:hypothetical protein C0Q70_08901 [Pomacea canaliculata]|uniref:Uncharacterized protein n=2 Tax=Pomacea canaliculata TaxID=400727 RepID=A0A2T7P8C4_POMCA|nr:hypothetical protein C0Q70_08901 [Pomacea canaliculata]
MTDLQNKSKNSFERVKEGLEEALKVGFKTTLETARATNLLSYCLFCLGNLTEANKQIDKSRALDDQKTNIVSLANKAFILTYMDYYDRAQEQILVLQELKKQADFPYLVTKAKGELAFSYTRMGPLFYSQATRLFREILPNARGEEQFLWEFGLALTYRRVMHIQNIEVITVIDNQEVRSLGEMTLKLLNDIIRGSKSKNLQAKAYSELALLLNQNRTNTRFNQEAGISAEKACNKALELDEEDYSVLVKTGRIFRYLKKTEMSCQLLETAVSIRPSSTAFHHLGLTYKALATAAVYRGSSSFTRGRGSFRGTGDRGRGGGWRGRGGRGRMSEETWSGQIRDGMRRDWIGVNARRSDPMVGQNSVVYYGRGRARQSGNWRGTREFTCRSADYRQSESKSDTHGKYYAQKQESVCYSSLLGAERATTHIKETSIKGDDCSLNAAFGMMSLDSVDHSDSAKSVSSTYKVGETLTQRELKKMVKTPSGNETKFSRSNPYIPKALLYLEKAVKFSKDENKRAVYDLALLHKALEEYDNALHLLLEIRSNKSMMIGAFDKVNAWEQTGLILKTMSKNETNEEEKKKLDKEGETMLRTALHEAMRLFSRTPGIQQQVCHVWNSFSTLLADIENSDGNTREKIREKARLLTLVSKHKESISLLQELKSISSQSENDPETLKILIENYSETEDYESAAIFIDLLKCSSEGNPTMSLFGDKYYTQKVYIKAAKQHLMTSCDKPKSSSAELARRFFLAAFTDVVSDVFHVGGSSASSCCSSDTWETSSSSDSKDIEGWHVMLLYEDRDENMEAHANSLKSLLN